jgi:hypothetical protein
MQAIATLRVYTNVPQIYAQTLQRGMKIGLDLSRASGKDLQGTLVRTADAIDPRQPHAAGRVDVDNRAGELLPGSLAQVHFKTPTAGRDVHCAHGRADLPSRRHELGKWSTATRRAPGAVVIGEDDGATCRSSVRPQPGRPGDPGSARLADRRRKGATWCNRGAARPGGGL